MLTRRIIIATVTVLLLIVFVLWGSGWVQDRVKDSSNTEKAELVTKIDSVNKSIAAIPEPDDQLVSRLAQLQIELEEVGKTIPSSLDSTTVINYILELAESCNVTAVPLQTEDWSPFGDHYMVYTLQIRAEGEYAEIADFISRLESGEYDNLIISSLEITGGVIPGDEPDAANLQIAIFTRN
ncbi:MAG: hypothetical protein WC370_10350 [Dehalococcoidales bacterium]|jgi:hypothetical protein